MRIIKAILGGERDVKKLGEMRDRRCQASAEEIAESLVGNYRQEHLFSLKQAVELFEIYQEKILECETEMEKYLKSLPHEREDEPPPLPEGEKRNRISFNVRDEAWKLTGVDLFRINGLNSADGVADHVGGWSGCGQPVSDREAFFELVGAESE